MAIFKLHIFYLPVYRELLPDDWKGESDPRAPRMLFRGPTVSEFVEMFGRDPRENADQTAREVARSLSESVDHLRPMVRRCLGDWSLSALDGQGIEHLTAVSLHDFQRAWMESGRPDEAEDLLPLGDGGPPA